MIALDLSKSNSQFLRPSVLTIQLFDAFSVAGASFKAIVATGQTTRCLSTTEIIMKKLRGASGIGRGPRLIYLGPCIGKLYFLYHVL